MSRLRKFILLVAILVIIFVLSPIIYVEANKKIFENRVTEYLVNEKGYHPNDIELVEGVYGFKMPEFYTKVIFKDEPYIEYTYFAHGGVAQFDYEIIDNVYNRITFKELKNYDSNGSIDKYK